MRQIWFRSEHGLPRTHEHWRLAALMKDADGLDRVRLGDLDPGFLRHEPSVAMVDFAEDLYRRTHGVIPEGEQHFEVLWQTAWLHSEATRSPDGR